MLPFDFFNAPNFAASTGRDATMNMASPSAPSTIRNLPYDENGNIIESRSRPRGAGFGVATAYQTPRAIQLLARPSFLTFIAAQ